MRMPLATLLGLCAALAALGSCAAAPAPKRREAEPSAAFLAHAARVEALVSGWAAGGGSRSLRPAAGAGEAVSAAWWGFDPEDSTEALQSALDSGARIVLVPRMPGPWLVSRGLRIGRGGFELLLEPGAEILAKEGAFRGIAETLLSAADVSDISILGYGAVLRMRKADYRRRPYERSEWRHALSLRGVTRSLVAGLRIESSGGDGVYIGTTGPQWGRAACEEVVLRDLELLDHHRQGISLISGRRLLVEGCRIAGTRGTLPMAGIDFEPNTGDPGFEDCLVRRCRIEGNAGAGILFAFERHRLRSEPESIRIEDCSIEGSPVAVWLLGLWRKPRGSVVFSNCELRGLRLYRNTEGFRVLFE